MDAVNFLTARAADLTSWFSTAAISKPHNSLTARSHMDTLEMFNRKRNGHACMMSIVFIVLFPLGAMSLHLPIQGVVRRIVTRVHAPIQLLGLAMMIGAMGLGIDIAKNDLGYFSPVQAHVVLGLVTTSTIILVQPALGVVNHLLFKKTQKKSVYSYVHRYVGRATIIMGWVNSYLGFKLYGFELVKTSSLIRNFTLMGALGAIWFSLVALDFLERHFFQSKDGTPRRGWKEVVGGRRKGELDEPATKDKQDVEVAEA